MKEQFRYKKFRGSIRIKYKDANGIEKWWEADQQNLIDLICSIIKQYRLEGYSLTSRQLYYQLVARDIIPNAQKVYTRICKLLVDLRYNGEIDWSAIEDRGRVPQKHSEWDDINGLIKSALAAYRLPRWTDQDHYIELYCEKQALEGVLKPVADKYHMYFGVNKGYSSASTMYDIAQRMRDQIAEGKECIILYLGDHDPSGLDMVRDINKRVCEFLRIDPDYECDFRVEQIALNQAQIKQYKPVPNPARMEDPRAKWYIKEFGKVSWELDALEPKVLQQIAEDAILEYIDLDDYNRWIARESEEAKQLVEFGKSIKKKK